MHKVTVAPLVLLSVVDHFNRVSTNGKKRVVGVILGDNSSEEVHVTNSFAVPFEEDPKNPDIWYLDQHYIECMLDMFKKINAKERLIGWYHSGPRLRPADMAISQMFKKFTLNPLLLIVDVEATHGGIPTSAYHVIDEIKQDGTSAGKTFKHIPSSILAEEAEEIGVEHLLRDVADDSNGNLSQRIEQQLTSLKNLSQRLKDIKRYLDNVLSGKLPLNHSVLNELQNVFNLLPNLSRNSNLQRAFTTNTNDQMMVVYLSSLVRAVISFHDMIDNKIGNKKESERKNEKEEVEASA